MKGGARANTGPPPDPNAIRRSKPSDSPWRRLPYAGRQKPAPEWPLPAPTKRELDLWVGEWARPQAIEWERLGLEIEVALYVRSIVAAEEKDARAEARVLVMRYMESLGVSVPGMARHRWIIDDPTAPALGPGVTSDPRRRTAKTRFRAIEGGRATGT